MQEALSASFPSSNPMPNGFRVCIVPPSLCALSTDFCLDPFFSKGVRAVENLAGIARARVRQRLDVEGQTDRVDLLARLMQGKDDNGQPLGRDELTAEALTQLIAGSDTTSNTSCAILFHVLRHPNVVKNLQEELDAAIPASVDVPTYDMVKDCK